MDLDHPAVLFSGLVIGAVGFGLFLYGKKAPDLPTLAAGCALGVLPMFAHSLVVLWGVTAVCAGGLYAMKRLGA